MKELIRRFLKFVDDNKIWAVTIAIPLLGAIPLYIYALSIGELPDFSISELTGTLLASFLTEVVIGGSTVIYLLLTGLAARSAVNAFYPDAPGNTHNNHEYLIRGNFIQGVTMFSLLAWFGLATSPLDTWLTSEATGLARCAYWIALGSSALLVAIDWRNGRRPFKYALLSAFASSCSFLAVLLISYSRGYVTIHSDQSSSSTNAAAPLDKLHTLITNPDIEKWLLQDHLTVTASTAALIILVATPALVRITRARRHTNKSGGNSQPIFKNEKLKLLAAKLWVTLVFWFLSAAAFAFLYLIAATSPLHSQSVTLLFGGSIFIFLNWAAFSIKDWKQRILLGAITFCVVFIMLPIQTSNATLLPKMIVNVLGLGNRHAAVIVLASTECPALAQYGVICKSEKDTSIGITNANILDRLGSTVLIELQIKQTADASDAKKAQSPDTQASSATQTQAASTTASANHASPSNISLVPLTLSKPKNSKMKDLAALYPCDSALAEKLRSVDSEKANSLVCAKLSVPKDHLIGRTINGPATYLGEFSQYIQAGQ